VITGIAGPARRALAAWAAFAVLVAGVVVLGPAIPARAAASTIDPSALGSLTIHKLRQPDDISGLQPGTGMEIIPEPDLDPVPGAEFMIRRVDGIDLATTGGWADTFVLSGAFDPEDPVGSIAPRLLVDPQTATTGVDGAAVFGSLPIGVYVVEETSAGGVKPFVVVLPVTDPVARDSWVYDVHVYPKAPMTSVPADPGFVTKAAIDSPTHKVGDIVTWHITGQILQGGDVLWWRITDHLDPRLRFVGARVKLQDGFPVTNVADPGGTDYEVVMDDDDTIRVEFLGPPGSNGLAVLTAHNTTLVDIEVDTELLDASTVPNSALINTSIWDDPVGVHLVSGSTAPAITAWGSVEIHKTTAGGAPLAGAVFTVHSSEADARSGANALPLTSGTQVVSGPDGHAVVDGLRYSAIANGMTVTPGDPEYREYWLREAQAPFGYDAITDPIPFTIDSDSTSGAVIITVANSMNPVADLAFTGFANLPWALLGGGLVVGGYFLVLLTRRRRRTRAEVSV